MLLRKQSSPATPDAEHAEYYVATDGTAHFVVDVVDTAVHDGEPVPLTESGGDPATIPDTVQLYTKDVGGITELFSRNGDGDVAQVTSAGVINTPPVNNTFFASRQVSAKFDFAGTSSPSLGLLGLDLEQTLTVPDLTWCLVHSRLSLAMTDVPITGDETIVSLSTLLMSDAAGYYTDRAVSTGSGIYGGSGGAGLVLPFGLLPAVILDEIPGITGLDADAAVLLVYTGVPAAPLRVRGFIDTTVFTIPDPIP